MATKKVSKTPAVSKAAPGKKSAKVTVIAGSERTEAEIVTDVLKGKFKIPEKQGPAADLLYQLRAERLRIQKVVDAIEAREKELKNWFIENLSKADTSGAAGRFARAQVITDPQPQVEDWEALHKHIKKTGNFELLNRALNRTAAKERFENKKPVPGVIMFPVTKVSVTKV